MVFVFSVWIFFSGSRRKTGSFIKIFSIQIVSNARELFSSLTLTNVLFQENKYFIFAGFFTLIPIQKYIIFFLKSLAKKILNFHCKIGELELWTSSS
ncbi:MAG: hypothetical protein ACD_4C00294G0001 [uncultured bacterium (gcode 4)]|uniref:Uncharacterized protein n=1 Tax=uncultured bacterium (gcode 4) TaxID=1234023 RepID=K2GSV9_9BACT|nr:MAG: hypothetical protein ACD_4C00294G0001 [uncultured bacterium (gcode 4)]